MKLMRFFVLPLALWLSSNLGSLAAESTPVPAAPAKTEETNAQETLRSYLQLQEQIHATELAIDRGQKETERAAERASQALEERLKAIEQSLGVQRARELEAMQQSMQSANRVMLIVAGAFAAIGLLAMVLMAYFQWRTVNRLAELSAGLPAAHGLGPASPLPALGPGDSHLVTVGPAEQSNLRLLGALEQLDKRLQQIEHSGPSHLPEGSSHGNGASLSQTAGNGESSPPEAEPASGAARISLLLGKGQSQLNLDNAEGALACFDEVLALDPSHADALLKKGTALERLRRFDEAIALYDRVLAADSSLTIAYLYKGGLFNRLERFSEALECYEQALRSQEKNDVSADS